MRNSYLVLVLLILSSCSLFKGRREAIKANKKEDDALAKMVVPRAQYDEILHKYQLLLREKRKNEEILALGNNLGIKDSADSIKVPLYEEQRGKIKSSTVDVLSELKRRPKKFVKVDSGSSAGALKRPSKGQIQYKKKRFRNDMGKLKKALKLIDEKKYDMAISKLRSLEHSGHAQMKVRARFYKAEIWFAQERFDLAMQVYEEVLHNYGFSNLVLKALDRLILCTEKLNLYEKKQRYYSLRYDIFGGV